MQTAPKVVNGRNYQTLVGIFAIHKKMKKAIRPTTKAVPANKAILFMSFSVPLGMTRIPFTQRAIATRASVIHNQRNHGTVGDIESERFVQISAGRKPICDSTDQSCASRMIARYGSNVIAAGTPIAIAARAFLKSWHRILTTAAATQTARSKNEF